MKKENQLLNRMLKAIGVSKDEAQADVAEVVQEAATDEVQAAATDDTITLDLQAELDKALADFETYKSEANALLADAEAKAAGLVTQVASLTAEKEDALQKLEAATTALAEVEQAKADAIAEAKKVKLATRKEKIVAAIGTEKAEGLMAATEELDDKAFEAVVSALAGSVEAEANTDLFNEVGVDAKTQAGVEEKPTHFNTFIKK